jgi:glycosyltransferase involved in cell wall biosynthesis
MTSPLLTIVIPTYNRPQQILRRVEELLPHLSAETELLIIDNHSPSSVEDLVRRSFDLTQSHVRFVRNRFNIGACGNICRCFEEATGEWMWMLGDDDITDPDAIRNILDEIRKSSPNPKIAGFTCSTGIFDYSESQLISSFEALCEELSDPIKLCNAIFISAHVYRLKLVQPHLRDAYLSISSYAPHLVIMLRCIESELDWKYLPFKSVHHTPPNSSTSWNPEIISAGLPLLLESVGETVKISHTFQNSLVHHLHNISLKRALRRIAFSTPQSLKFLEIYYFRVSPLMRGFSFFRMITLATLARTLSHNPGIHRLLMKIASEVTKKDTLDYDRGRL